MVENLKESDDFHGLTKKISDSFGIRPDAFDTVISTSQGRVGLHIKREMYDAFKRLVENSKATIKVSEHGGGYGWKEEVVEIPGMNIDVRYTVFNSYLEPHPSYLECNEPVQS